MPISRSFLVWLALVLACVVVDVVTAAPAAAVTPAAMVGDVYGKRGTDISTPRPWKRESEDLSPPGAVVEARAAGLSPEAALDEEMAKRGTDLSTPRGWREKRGKDVSTPRGWKREALPKVTPAPVA